MRKQRGYYNIFPSGGQIIAILVLVAIIGVFSWEGLKWLWSAIKPMIHTLTA